MKFKGKSFVLTIIELMSWVPTIGNGDHRRAVYARWVRLPALQSERVDHLAWVRHGKYVGPVQTVGQACLQIPMTVLVPRSLLYHPSIVCFD